MKHWRGCFLFGKMSFDLSFFCNNVDPSSNKLLCWIVRPNKQTYKQSANMRGDGYNVSSFCTFRLLLSFEFKTRFFVSKIVCHENTFCANRSIWFVDKNERRQRRRNKNAILCIYSTRVCISLSLPHALFNRVCLFVTFYSNYSILIPKSAISTV